MRKERFTGPMGLWMQKHLTLRHSLGFLYEGATYSLDAFDQYLLKHYPICKTISREMVVGFLKSRDKSSLLSLSQDNLNLRQFCRFMFQFDSTTYIPEKGLVKRSKPQVQPHIFTEDEIIQVITFVKKMQVRGDELWPFTYSTIIGLLWVTGMRIGEVVRLKIKDIDVVEGVLTVRQTKFFKSRLIPLSSSSNQVLIDYKKQRTINGYNEDPEASFFVNRRKKACNIATTPKTIKDLITKAGIKTAQSKTPRVHDIRHSFATHCVLGFYQNNKDPTVYLPVLATYLGHANIANTQVYLHPSIELLNLAGQKLQSYIHTQLGEENETR